MYVSSKVLNFAYNKISSESRMYSTSFPYTRTQPVYTLARYFIKCGITDIAANMNEYQVRSFMSNIYLCR